MTDNGLTPPAFADGAETVLSVEGLSTSFFTRDGTIRAVRDVNFSVRRGEVVGIVGALVVRRAAPLGLVH